MVRMFVGKVGKLRVNIWKLGYALTLPVIGVIIGLVAYPFFSALILSFTSKYIGRPAVFIGLRNYVELIKDPVFWRVVRNSSVFTGSAVGIKVFLGIIVALILYQKFVGRNLVRALVLLPWATPSLVVSLTWRWMYDDMLGVLNYLLQTAGIISAPICWLGDARLAMPAVIAVNVWRGTPFFALCILAGLQTIPQSLYDAGKVDGASAVQCFRYITFPYIKIVLIIIVLLSTIWTFNDFQIVFILTRGGPGNTTHIFSTYTYDIAFLGQRLGKGIAISIFVTPLFIFFIFFITHYIMGGKK